MTYTLEYTSTPPGSSDGWDSPIWSKAQTVQLTHFHADSSEHRPDARVRLLYTDTAIHGLFHVKDRYVLAHRTAFQDSVCRDSCVEFFVQPHPDVGYFNLEINCIGTALLHHMKPDKSPGLPIGPEACAQLGIIPSLPCEPILQEIAEPVTWTLGFTLPFALLEAYTGQPCGPTQTGWRGNFFKCADESSHPHWASWRSVGEPLNFHKPERFGALAFADPPTSLASEIPAKAAGHGRA